MYRITLFLIIACLSVPASAGFYRWVDENGQIHYSDNLPPNQSGQGHAELDQLGRSVRHTNPAKTADQLQQEAQASLLAQEREEAAQRQSSLDRALINSFTSTDQIDALANERLSTIDGKMQETQRKLDKVRERLTRTEKRKDWFENQKKPVPSQIKANIREYHKQVSLYEKDLELHRVKRATTVAKLLKDKQRFLELQAELSQSSH